MIIEPPAPGSTERRACLDHAHHCPTCQDPVLRCHVFSKLWTTYEQARGPLTHRRPA